MPENECPLLELHRTCRSSGPTSEVDPKRPSYREGGLGFRS